MTIKVSFAGVMDVHTAFWIGLETLRVLTGGSDTRWQLLLKWKLSADDEDDDEDDYDGKHHDDDDDDSSNSMNRMHHGQWKWIAYDGFKVNADFSLTIGKLIARDYSSKTDFDPFNTGFVSIP